MAVVTANNTRLTSITRTSFDVRVDVVAASANAGTGWAAAATAELPASAAQPGHLALRIFEMETFKQRTVTSSNVICVTATGSQIKCHLV